MTTVLADISPEQWVELVAVPDDELRARLLRLGFLDGRVKCRLQIRNGPVVVCRHGTAIAVGRALARKISVERTDAMMHSDDSEP